MSRPTKSKQRLAEEVATSVARINKERLRERADDLRPFDLTAQQVWLLAELSEGEGVPIGSLAEAMHCHGSNVTGMVDRLEARGLVIRVPSPNDRRVKLVALTPEGRALRGKVTAVASRPPHVLVDRLDDEQLATLNQLLAVVCRDLPDPAHPHPRRGKERTTR